MNKLGNYITGHWITGDGEGQTLFNAVTGAAIGAATTKGLDFASITGYARTVGNPALRKMTFHQRGNMLKALAQHLRNHLDKFYSISYQTGATKADSWVDIEGGIGNLFANASLRRKFPDEIFCIDGESHNLGKHNTFMGTHILTPKEGVAIHINAFNFPVWGMLEKIAVNLLAGMPCIVKPATVTSYLTEAVVKEIIASKILPEGSLQLICGSAGDLLDHVMSQDVVTFTGSASTGLMLKSNPNILRENVPFTMEADSLNCIVLGNDVQPGMPEWDIFVKEVRKEMTLKAGQRCTGIRRIFVPENKMEDMWKAIALALSQTTIGNPLNSTVRMGSLAGETQRNEVKQQVQKLLASSQIVYGSLDSVSVIDADSKQGAFLSPLLLMNDEPFASAAVHEVEAFGPVSTIMPYKNLDEAIVLSKMGKGSLVSSIVTADDSIAKKYVINAASHHGRILVLNNECAKESTGHGSPLPLLVHGGPGRAGGGEEMGGIRGVKHYLQRTAIQGSPNMITAITNVYQPNAAGKDPGKHPFKKYFEELVIGDQIITEKRVITSEDIDRFADLSGDHFYAHIAGTDFTGTMFERQVAHGYFIMSIAAGLFVDSYEKNPVLLNYGIDELRFTKPVYPGNEIHIRFTCKEKLPNDKRVVEKPEDFKRGDDIDKGIVKWLVEMIDDTNEVTGIATILTMVQKKSSNFYKNYFMADAYVKSHIEHGINTIEFFHPQSNSLPNKILNELAKEIHYAGTHDETRVIILKSAGDKTFCAGACFDELVAIQNEAEGLHFFSGFAQVINAMRKCPKFIIGRIQGKCVGGGVGLVAAVDYAIATDKADLKLSELAVGIGPFVVGPAIERKIGIAAFSALAIDANGWRNADWAKRKGLFSEIHDSIENMDDAIVRLSNTLTHSNPQAMAEMKKIFWRGTEHWDELLKERAAISGRLVLSDFTKKAIAKFKTK